MSNKLKEKWGGRCILHGTINDCGGSICKWSDVHRRDDDQRRALFNLLWAMNVYNVWEAFALFCPEAFIQLASPELYTQFSHLLPSTLPSVDDVLNDIRQERSTQVAKAHDLTLVETIVLDMEIE